MSPQGGERDKTVVPSNVRVQHKQIIIDTDDTVLRQRYVMLFYLGKWMTNRMRVATTDTVACTGE